MEPGKRIHIVSANSGAIILNGSNATVVEIDENLIFTNKYGRFSGMSCIEYGGTVRRIAGGIFTKNYPDIDHYGEPVYVWVDNCDDEIYKFYPELSEYYLI